MDRVNVHHNVCSRPVFVVVRATDQPRFSMGITGGHYCVMSTTGMIGDGVKRTERTITCFWLVPVVGLTT